MHIDTFLTHILPHLDILDTEKDDITAVLTETGSLTDDQMDMVEEALEAKMDEEIDNIHNIYENYYDLLQIEHFLSQAEEIAEKADLDTEKIREEYNTLFDARLKDIEAAQTPEDKVKVEEVYGSKVEALDAQVLKALEPYMQEMADLGEDLAE